jgi:antitoxin (DNA-binding transcriptional repressor) of toxin-antitoxin stability system
VAKEVSATEAARRLGDLLARVRYRGESFLIRRGKTLVARLGPATEQPLRTGSEIAGMWADRPRIAAPEARAFASAVTEGRKRLNRPPRDPWQR